MFEDDEQFKNFLQSMDEFSVLHIDQDNELLEDQHDQNYQNKIVEKLSCSKV